MDKIWAANTATEAPIPGTENGYPSDGDIGTGTPATEPGAYWFWMITAELLALIIGAGLVPNGSLLNQVFSAVQAIAAQAAATAASAAQTAAIAAATALASAAQTAAVAAATTLANAAQAAAIAAATTLANAAQAAAQTTVLSWFTGSNQLLSANGYQKLPGGQIKQRCETTASPSSIVTITFPITFPTQAFKPRVLATNPSATSGGDNNFVGATLIDWTNSNCRVAVGAMSVGSSTTVVVDVEGD